MANPRDLARNLRPEINTGTTASPSWTEIKGVTSLEPSRSRTTTDTTGFDSGGAGEHLVPRLDKSVSIGGFLVYDVNNSGARDAGQEALDGFADSIGDDAKFEFRIVHRTTDEIMAHYNEATAELATPMGGGTDAASAWSCTITRSGADANDVGNSA